MKVVTLGYHDVVARLDAPTGPLRKCPNLYALSRSAFRQHLRAVREAGAAVRLVSEIEADDAITPVCLTFDDGAIGAYECAADELERVGWRGHFFITTDWVGRPGFLDKHQIRDLHGRGHVIGSHTCSHPARMSSLSWDQLTREWTTSCRILADTLGAAVECASVSDGYYSRNVGRSAAASGVHFLFNSEPVARVGEVDGCRILGRYPIFANTSPAIAGLFVSGSRALRAKEFALWQVKKALKSVGGEAYLKVRNSVLSR